MSDNDRLEHLRQRLMAGNISRRDFVKRTAALGVGATAITGILAACGSSNKSTPTTASGGGAGATTPTTAITVNQNASPSSSPAAQGTTAPLGKAGGSVTLRARRRTPTTSIR